MIGLLSLLNFSLSLGIVFAGSTQANQAVVQNTAVVSEDISLFDFQRGMEFATSVNCVEVINENRYPNATSSTPFEAANPSTYLGRIYINATGNAAMVVKNDVLKTIYVSFRESETDQLWLEDFKVLLVAPVALTTPYYVNASSQIPQGMKVHYGFHDGYHDVRNGLIPLIQQAADANPSYKIIFTGHSLGAAIALIGAVDFSLQLPQYVDRVGAILMGCPRAGNTVFAAFVNSLPFAGRIHRLVNKSDPFVHALLEVFGYEHVFREWTMNPTTVAVPAINPQVTICPPNPNGSGECVNADLLKIPNPEVHPPDAYAFALGLTTSCLCVRSRS